MTSPHSCPLFCHISHICMTEQDMNSLIGVVPGPFLLVLGPPRGPWEGHFCPILPGNLLKTTKNPYLPHNRLKLLKIPHFTLEIPINTLVPCRIRVIIGNPSENPPKSQIWVPRAQKWGILGSKIGQKRAYFGGILGPKCAPRAQIFRPQN